MNDEIPSQATDAGSPSSDDMTDDPSRLAELVHDLTAQRDALEQVIEHTPEASLVMLDRDFNFKYVNTTYADSCHIPREDLLGRNHFAMFPNEENEAIFRRALETGEPVEFKEKPFLFPHDPGRGVTYWDWTLTPIKDGRGQVESFVFSLVDVTERVVRERLTDALAQLDVVLHSSLDTGEIIRGVIEGATGASACDSVAVGVREGSEWVVHVADGPLKAFDRTRLAAADVPIAERAASTRSTVVVSEADADDAVREHFGRFGLKSVMNVPLQVRGEVIGVLAFHYHEAPIVFTDELIEFGERVGASLSLAIANARIVEIERRRTELEDALNRMLTYFISARDPDEVLREVVEESVRASAADYSIITVVEKAEWAVTHSFGEPGVARMSVAYEYGERPVIVEAAETRQVQLVEDALADPRTNKDIMRTYGIRAFAAIPLVMRSELLGVLELVYLKGPVRFDDAIIAFFERLMVAATVALEESQRSAFERQVSETLQEALIVLPESVEGLVLAHEYRAASDASRVGGDFYDVFDLDNGLVGLTIGDVSGKGFKAAAFTSLIKNTVRAHSVKKGTTPSEAMALAHQVLYRGSEPEIFATVFFGLLDRRDGRLLYCNAGHPSVVLLRQEGSVTPLAATSSVVGAVADASYRDAETWVEPGDLLFMYTDGLTEARQGDELFGEERLFHALEGMAGLAPGEVLNAVTERVSAFAGGRLSDDLALLAICRPSDDWGISTQLKLDVR